MQDHWQSRGLRATRCAGGLGFRSHTDCTQWEAVGANGFACLNTVEQSLCSTIPVDCAVQFLPVLVQYSLLLKHVIVT